MNEMGTILLIEGNETIQGWIRRILPGEELKVLKTFPGDEEIPFPEHPEQTAGMSAPGLDEVVRNFLKTEARAHGSIHEQIIGRVEKSLIGIVLEEEQGNQVRAARRLGINRNTLRKKMKELQITTRVVAR